MRRLLWTAWLAGTALVLLILTCLGLTAFVSIGLPAKFANSDGSLFRAPNREATSKIAVFGDTQKGLAGFAELAQRAKDANIDLAIHTGDLVSRADKGHYDLASVWVARADWYIPFVVVPGNHDIKGGDGLFEKRIGSRQFAFRWGPVEIVIVDNAVGPPDEGAVEQMLKAAKGPILLFMHVPPNEAPAFTFKPKPAYASFLGLMRKYPVAYVFSGHAHGYSRVENGGITFISNGVGGDSDSWQFNQKAYVTIVEASGTTLKAEEIAIDPVFSFKANLEHLAVGHVTEIILRRAWGIPALLGLILALYFGFKGLRRRTKKKESEDPEERPPLKLGEVEPEQKPGKFIPGKISEPPDVVI